MYSVCENLGQTQEIDIGKDSGKQIFYYLSHKTADIMRKFTVMKRYCSKNGRWGTTDLNIISIIPTIRNNKATFKITTEKRTFHVDKKVYETKGFMTNVF
jgi:hypothetical protein